MHEVIEKARSALLIGDDWVEETSGGVHEHVNPATGQVQRAVPLAGPDEIDRAVRTADSAQRGWAATPPEQRRSVLLRLADLIEANGAELGTLTTLENGTPASFTPLACSVLGPEYFRYYAGWCEKLEGAVIPVYPGGGLDYTMPQPYGVVAAIIPWNGPLGAIGMKVAPALAAGNAVVLKPPELAPFTSLRVAELALEAGLPPGVLNVVPGGPAAGQALVSHPDVDKITFTGGSSTAVEVLRGAAEHQTPVLCELGGKSANIVFADADLDAVVPMAVMFSVAALSGQGCSLGTRLLVHDEVYDEVIGRLRPVVDALIIGDPLDASTQMGPVISAAQRARIEAVTQRARDSGAGRLLVGGGRVALDGDLAGGFFLEPTVFVDVPPTSEIAQEEIFGPVLSVLRFADEAEAVAVANGTRYGLAGYVWTNDVNRAHRVAAALDAGTVGVNGFPLVPPNAPFGGFKASGYGREGGKPGLDEFVRLKNVYMPIG